MVSLISFIGMPVKNSYCDLVYSWSRLELHEFSFSLKQKKCRVCDCKRMCEWGI